MKKRNVAFGYRYENGKISVNKNEEKVIRKIFDSYLAGMSLIQIASILNDEKIEYMPSVIGWNKARVMRIIDDERYSGNEMYPQIITYETHEKLKCLKESKSTQQDVDRNNIIYNLYAPVMCKKCGEKMTRHYTRHGIKKEIWSCPSKACTRGVVISDQELIKKIAECLSTIIKDPDMIQIKERSNISNNDSKIQQEIEMAHAENRDNVTEMIFQSISDKYDCIDSETYIAMRIKHIFCDTALDETSLPYLLKKTVKKMILGREPSVCIMLLNNQIIESEE